MKYSVETMDPEIFHRCCPGLSFSSILETLQKVVEIFGRDRVSSNFILGLGESDDYVLSGVDLLAEMSIISVLRPISPQPLLKQEIDVARRSAERLPKLARKTREILNEHGLRADLAETMCLPCTGCDITPLRDV